MANLDDAVLIEAPASTDGVDVRVRAIAVG